VRLKAGTNKVVDAERLFQFLLVRLKAKSFNDDPVFSFISIPSGAIKSFAFLKASPILSISIPSGAIKSDYCNSYSVAGTKHHFNSFWCD